MSRRFACVIDSFLSQRGLGPRLTTTGLLAVALACGDDGADGSGGGADAGSAPDAVGADGGGADAASADAGMDAGAPEPTVEVGTGLGGYEAMEAGQTLEFVLGPQSTGDPIRGYHVWGAVRAMGVDPDPVTTRFFVLTRGDRTQVGEARDRTRPLIPDGTGAWVGFATPVILDDCCPLRGAELLLRVELEDAQGVELSDEVVFVGFDRCPDGAGGDVCD